MVMVCTLPRIPRLFLDRRALSPSPLLARLRRAESPSLQKTRNGALQLSPTRVVEALMLATLLLAAITITVEPRPAYIEQSATSQFVNFDLIVENSTDEPLDVDEVQVSVHDRAGKLVLRKFVDGTGTRPSIRTVDVAAVPAKGTALLFNPFDRFDHDLDLSSMTFDLKLSSKDGERRFDASVTVEPRTYVTKAPLILPVKGAMIVYDGHDFYAHHRRWDYTIPMLRQLGIQDEFHALQLRLRAGECGRCDVRRGCAEERELVWIRTRNSRGGRRHGRGARRRSAGRPQVRSRIDRGTRTMRVFGNYVVIDHGNGEFGLYGHIRQGSGRVKVGQRVKRGDVVAAIGASGSSMFPHLHFELQTATGTDSEGLPSTFRDFVRVQGAKRVAVKAGIVESGEIVESNR